MRGTKNILVINGGSSSDKLSLFCLQSACATISYEPQWQAEVDFPSGSVDEIEWDQLLTRALSPLTGGGHHLLKSFSDINIVGHRVVHGADKYNSAVIITEQVKSDIAQFIPLAPLHNKVALSQIEAMQRLLPNAKQVAVFDTAFHTTLPGTASTYPVPFEWHEKYGIKRFGFHGINHQYCAQQVANYFKRDLSNLSLITCHLGSGCSLAAIENGKSVNTTMGFTPLEGLMMSTRSGSIDPGILFYLLKTGKMSPAELETALNKNSGLKGICGISDMKNVIQTMSNNSPEGKQAKLAFDMFVAHLKAGICAMRASLNKLDAIVFTGGIGEHSSLVRERTCAGLHFLDLLLDKNENEKNNQDKIKKKSSHAMDSLPGLGDISAENSKTKVLVIKAREDLAIAQQCLAP